MTISINMLNGKQKLVERKCLLCGFRHIKSGPCDQTTTERIATLRITELTEGERNWMEAIKLIGEEGSYVVQWEESTGQRLSEFLGCQDPIDNWGDLDEEEET